MAEQIEYLVRANKDLVIEWITALHDELIQVHRSVKIDSVMIRLFWPDSNLYVTDEDGRRASRVKLGEVHTAWAQLLSLPGGSTLLRLEKVEGEWAKLEPVWARLLGELARLEQYGQPPAAQEGQAGPEIEHKDREFIKLWQQGLTAAQMAAKLSLTQKTVNNKVSELRHKYGEEQVPKRR